MPERVCEGECVLSFVCACVRERVCVCCLLCVRVCSCVCQLVDCHSKEPEAILQ